MARNRKSVEFMTAQEVQASRDSRIRKAKLREKHPPLQDPGPYSADALADALAEAYAEDIELPDDGIYRF